MKKIFLAVIILSQLLLAAPNSVFAQATGTPSGGDPNATPSGSQTGPAAPPTESVPVGIPGQIGVPTNNPVNGVNANNTGTTAKSQTTAANSCSAIKFKSALDILIWLKCVMVAILVPLIFAAAFVVFLWGVLKFMYASDATKKKEGQGLIWWGLIGLFVMVSVWGIIKIAATTLGIDPVAVPLLQTDYLDVKNANTK